MDSNHHLTESAKESMRIGRDCVSMSHFPEARMVYNVMAALVVEVAELRAAIESQAEKN